MSRPDMRLNPEMFETLVEMLRGLQQQLFGRLFPLDPETPPAADLELERLADMLEPMGRLEQIWLQPRSASQRWPRKLVAATGRWWPLLRRRRLGQMVQACLRVGLSVGHVDQRVALLADLGIGRGQMSRWRALMADTVKARLHDPMLGLHPMVWHHLAEMAWSDPRQRLWLQRLLQGFLLERVWVTPAERRAFILPDPRTTWLLLALVPAAGKTRRFRRRRTLLHWRHLQRQAAVLTRTPAWAGFADQWILLHALHHLPVRDRARRPARGLAALPLAHRGADPDAVPAPPSITAPDSLVTPLPEWYDQLNEAFGYQAPSRSS